MTEADQDTYHTITESINTEEKTAVLIVDVQDFCCNPKRLAGNKETDFVAGEIQRLAPEFRKAAIPVYAVYYDAPDFYKFTPEEKDVLIKKTRNSAFEEGSSNIEKILKEKSIKNLLVCGFNRTSCVLRTVVDANKLGFKTYLLDDLTGEGNPVNPSNNKLANLEMENAGTKIIKAETFLSYIKKGF